LGTYSLPNLSEREALPSGVEAYGPEAELEAAVPCKALQVIDKADFLTPLLVSP